MAGTKSTITHAVESDAVLNGPEEVTLFHASGKTIRVPEADAAFWLDQGFRHDIADLGATVAELKAVFPEALDAIVRYAEGVQVDGVIDPSDDAAKATAEYSMRRLELLWGQLNRDINYRYAVKQGEAVAMATPDGTAMDVDPNDVERYLEQGWTRG
jgi:hypothetical protein